MIIYKYRIGGKIAVIASKFHLENQKILIIILNRTLLNDRINIINKVLCVYLNQKTFLFLHSWINSPTNLNSL